MELRKQAQTISQRQGEKERQRTEVEKMWTAFTTWNYTRGMKKSAFRGMLYVLPFISCSRPMHSTISSDLTQGNRGNRYFGLCMFST